MPQTQTSTNTLTSEQKAATVVVALGADKASKVYKYLNPDEVEKLTLEVAKLGHIEAARTEEVLDDFYKTCLTRKVVTDGGMEYARTVLEKAYGESTARELLQKVAKYLKNRSFEFLQKMDSKNLFAVLQYERPQTIAMVLSYSDAEQAAEVITELPEDRRIKVVEAIARMESASPEAIKIVEKQLRNKFNSILTTDFTTIGGVDYIADVMNNRRQGLDNSPLHSWRSNGFFHSQSPPPKAAPPSGKTFGPAFWYRPCPLPDLCRPHKDE